MKSISLCCIILFFAQLASYGQDELSDISLKINATSWITSGLAYEAEVRVAPTFSLVGGLAYHRELEFINSIWGKYFDGYSIVGGGRKYIGNSQLSYGELSYRYGERNGYTSTKNSSLKVWYHESRFENNIRLMAGKVKYAHFGLIEFYAGAGLNFMQVHLSEINHNHPDFSGSDALEDVGLDKSGLRLSPTYHLGIKLGLHFNPFKRGRNAG